MPDLSIDRNRLIQSQEYRDQISRDYSDAVSKMAQEHGINPPDINKMSRVGVDGSESLLERLATRIELTPFFKQSIHLKLTSGISHNF